MSDDVVKAAAEHFPQIRTMTAKVRFTPSEDEILSKANELARRQGYASFEHMRRDPWGRHDRIILDPPERPK